MHLPHYGPVHRAAMTVRPLIPPESPFERVMPVYRAPNHGVRPRLHRRRGVWWEPAGRRTDGAAPARTGAVAGGGIVDVRV
jgi:hypothetical protein